MNISLKPEHERFIQAQLQNGKYENAYEVIEEAFRLLEERDYREDSSASRTLKEQRIEALKQKIASGTAQIAKGQVTDGEVVFANLRDKIRSYSESKE